MTVQDNNARHESWLNVYLDAFERRGMHPEPEQRHDLPERARRPDFSVPNDDGLRQVFLEIKSHEPDKMTGVIRFSDAEMLQIKDEIMIGVKMSEQRTVGLVMHRDYLAADQRDELLDHTQKVDGTLIFLDLKEAAQNVELVKDIIERGISEVLRDRADELGVGRSDDRAASEAQALIVDAEQGDDGKRWQAALADDQMTDRTESPERSDVATDAANREGTPDRSGAGHDSAADSNDERDGPIVDAERHEDGREWEAALVVDGAESDSTEDPRPPGLEPDAEGSPDKVAGGQDRVASNDQTDELIVDNEQGEDGTRWERHRTDFGPDADEGAEGAEVGPETTGAEGLVDLNPSFGPSHIE